MEEDASAQTMTISALRCRGAAFASLRLGENRRLNKEANCSQRRKGAKATPSISQRPSTPGQVQKPLRGWGRNFKKRSESKRTVRSNEGIYDYGQTPK